MPRPNRAYGRPGTRVVPKNFEQSHARVMDKTRTATVSILPPAGRHTITVAADLTHTSVEPDPLYTDLTARIQELGDSRTVVVGDQEQTTVTHLVAVDRAVSGVPDKSRVVVTAASDESLVGRVLVVRQATHGSLRWERDLYAVLDLSAPFQTPTPDDPDNNNDDEGGVGEP